MDVEKDAIKFFNYMKLIKDVSQYSRSRTDQLNNKDYYFGMVRLQLLSNKVCSKMHGLPCRGLAASIIGSNTKNGPIK